MGRDLLTELLTRGATQIYVLHPFSNCKQHMQKYSFQEYISHDQIAHHDFTTGVFVSTNLQSDGLHLNQQGHQTMAACIYPILSKIQTSRWKGNMHPKIEPENNHE